MRPDCEAKVPEGNRLVVLDEKCFPGCGARSHQVFHGEHMSIGDIAYMGDIPQVEPVTDDEWGLVLGDACMDCWNQLVVAGPTEHRRAKGAGCHFAAGCIDDQSLGGSLSSVSGSLVGVIRDVGKLEVITLDSPYMREDGDVGHDSSTLW